LVLRQTLAMAHRSTSRMMIATAVENTLSIFCTS
jgi:hypothetical protein